MLFLFYDGYKYLGMPPLATPLPPLSTIAAHWAVALIVNDTAFYWMHRLMHHRVFYKRFHKKHHVFKADDGLSHFVVCTQTCIDIRM